MKESKEFLCLSTHLDISSPHYKGSVTYRFCPRETSHGRSSGDPPPPLETSRTFFDSPEAFEALFIVQALIVGRLAAKIGKIVTKRTKPVFLSPRLLTTNLNVSGGVMKIFEKFIIPGVEKLLF